MRIKSNGAILAVAAYLSASVSIARADTWPPDDASRLFGFAGCVSLVSVPDDTRYNVRFETDIRPALQPCTSCHINNSQGQLSLTVANARLSLIGADETGTPAVSEPAMLRVRPFVPTDSLIFNRINCTTHGNASVLLQKLFHDWIAAGALMPESPGGDRLFIANFEAIVRPGG
jgi:hypothetical protein